MTPDDLVGDFVRWLVIEKGRSAATVEAYRRDIGRYVEWLAEHHVAVEKVTTARVEEYLAGLRHGGLSASSVNRALAAIRGWSAYLFDEGYLVVDPTARITAGRRPRSLPKPLGEAVVARIVDGVAGDTPVERRDRVLLELLYGTGARVSEAIGIELQHLDFDEELILLTGKGDKQRLVPMGKSLREALLRYLEAGGRGELQTPASRSFLFVNQRGGPLTRKGVDLIVRRRALDAGVAASTVSAHVFRHSCATHMLEHGADIRVVQELLGHSSIATTQIYTGVSLTSLKSAYAEAHPRAHELH